MIYRKSSNEPPGGLFIFDAFWVGAYSRGGLFEGEAYKIIRQMPYKKPIVKAPFLPTITRSV